MTNRKQIFTRQGEAHFVNFSCLGRRRLLASPRARQIVMSELSRLQKKRDIHVSGFVIMPDHVHAVLWFDDDAELPAVMNVWKATSSIWLRRLYEETMPDMLPLLKRKRSGRERTCFWERRYYDFNILTPEKLREKLEYMHHNPVKKELCARPEDWRWSSALWYASRRSVGVEIEPGF